MVTQPKLSGATIVYSLFLLSCFLLLPSLLAAHTVRADSPTPGVSVGQWAHYTLSGPEAGGTVDSNFTVTAVAGTNVTFSDTDVQTDGSQATGLLWVDIVNGPPVPSSLNYFIVAPGLVKGSIIYPGRPTYSQLPIQDVNNAASLASATRTAVHLQAQNSTGTSTTFEDFYWDQATGMFTEIIKKQNGATQLHVLMDSTSLWQPDNPFQVYNTANLILTVTSAVLVAIVVVGAFAIRRRRRHH